ncbi:MAG TPA: hypothetical protein VFR31_02355 [Thermoanaerobaculia bacterium]|nr:hypothetical protein [Thermoanaerobaculia bacterium]
MRWVFSLLVLLSLMVVLGLPLALSGLPVAPWTVLPLVAALVPLAVRVRLPPLDIEERWPRPLAVLARIALILALALFVAKVALAPLWSWDHYAIWGMKSRHLLEEGRLDLDFLSEPGFEHSVPNYPVGLPMLWRLLALGGLPGPGFFEAVHVLFGLALALVTRRGLLRLGRSPGMADALAALLVASPLFWDTVSVGLADLPLALWATAGMVLVLEGKSWPAGVCLGFLPWIKEEGTSLALLALVAAVLIAERGRRFPLLVPAVLLIAGAEAVGRKLPNALTFFVGDWKERALARLSHPGEILSALGSDLIAWDWLGFWLLFAGALALALWRRDRTALLLAGVVLIQLGLYAAVYFLTYLPPVDHIRSSFTRVVAALVPLGILTVGSVQQARGNRT